MECVYLVNSNKSYQYANSSKKTYIDIELSGNKKKKKIEQKKVRTVYF